MFGPDPSLVVGALLLGAAANCPHPVVRQREKGAGCFPNTEEGRAGLRKLVFHSFKEKTEEKKAGERAMGTQGHGERVGFPLSHCPPPGPTPLQFWIQLPPIHSTDSFSINVLKMKILIKKIKTKKN